MILLKLFFLGGFELRSGYRQYIGTMVCLSTGSRLLIGIRQNAAIKCKEFFSSHLFSFRPLTKELLILGV